MCGVKTIKKAAICVCGDCMGKEYRYTIFDTEMGWVGILAAANGLLRSTLPQHSAQETCEQLGKEMNQAVRSPELFNSRVERLKAYFSGRLVVFPDEVDLSAATAFQRQVWETTRLIPYGETRSYLWIAEQIERPEAVRAVGQALGRNPLPVIVPCHRVVASDGTLGGFTGGLEVKRHLLRLEALAP